LGRNQHFISIVNNLCKLIPTFDGRPRSVVGRCWLGRTAATNSCGR